MKHQAVVVDMGLTYIVVLNFETVNNQLAVTLEKVYRVCPFDLKRRISK